jgi:hypothetical protein
VGPSRAPARCRVLRRPVVVHCRALMVKRPNSQRGKGMRSGHESRWTPDTNINTEGSDSWNCRTLRREIC